MVGSDTQPGDLIGQDFGPYHVVRRLGMGGMAETFEAVRTGPGGFSRQVCLKLVRAALREDAQSLLLFQREARLAAKLHHSNIVSIFDFGEIEGTFYMSLELVDGVDLQTFLASRRKLPFDQVAMIGHDLALALEHAHEPLVNSDGDGPLEEGVLHRDVSPSNVLISRNGEVKLTDFGLANVASGGTPLSSVKGKFPYMPPERLRDEPIDARADLFALGVMMYEAIAGRRPYDGGHDPATIMLIIAGEHPPLHEMAPEAPEALCEIIDSLIDGDRDKRPASASALVELLEPFVPPPSVRRRLGKMVVATDSYTARRSAPPSTPYTPTPSSGDARATTGLRRGLGKVALGLLLGAAMVGGVYASWPSTAVDDTANDSAAESAPTAGGVEPAAPEGPADRADDEGSTGVRPPPAATKPATSPLPRTKEKPAEPARLTVLVSPWGQVWINGKPRGTAPLKGTPLKPGRYKVSAGQDAPARSQIVRLRPGQRRTIRFDLVESGQRN